jgi:hypothetical protein
LGSHLANPEFTRSLDLCHLSSSDGRLRFFSDFATCEVEELPSLTLDVRIPDREDLVTCVLLANGSDSFAIFGLHLSLFCEYRYKAFSSPTHETPKCDYVSDLTTPDGSDPTALFSLELKQKNTLTVTLLAPLPELMVIGASRIPLG